MKTQIAFSDNINKGKFAALIEQAERLGALRTEVWQRFGSIKGIGLRDRTIRDNWLKEGRQFNVGATPWKQTLCDAIGDIKACREAAKFDAKQAIRWHTKDKIEQKRLYTLLKSDKYLDDRYLARTMRKHFKRGHNHTHNQIIVRSDDYTVFTLNEKVWIKIPSLIKGKRIAIPLSTNVVPKGNLRIILRNHKVEVHYAAEAIKTNDCGTQTLGVDKGYTEVLTDSDGEHHGVTLGAVLTKESDRLKLKYQRRNKLKAIARTKPWVNKHNLGRKKLDKQAVKHQSGVRTIVHEAVNLVIDKAAVIVTEDLTSPIAGKKFGKKVSRRLSAWTKGVIASAIENVSRRRGSTVIYVNAAYTSQMDSRNGTLSGKRCGEKFYCEDGEVLQADVNAARNVLARLYDSEISRWMPYKQVKAILLKRTSANRLKLLNQDSSCRLQNLSTESELSNEYVCILNLKQNIDDSTIDDKATADAALREKLTDALIPGYQAEFDPDEAEKVGAFHEDALSEQDALDSDVDLVVVAACKHPHFRPELFENIRTLRPELNANEPTLFANSLQTSLKTHINCKQENTTYSSESSHWQ